MGFTPDGVGLVGEQVTGVFMEPRPNNCPHKGLDISSSKTPKPFNSGVFGRVAAPLGGDWGTVTVNPFSSPNTRIQYLHCSSIAVGIGDLIAPWTRLGNTGATAPPDSGITGIHLHIQVEEPGAGSIECWGNRNFVDPATWQLEDLLAGIWFYENYGTEGNIDWNVRSTHRISGSSIGSRAGTEHHWTYRRKDGCYWTVDFYWPAERVTQRTQSGVLIDSPAGNCSGSTACGITLGCEARASQLEVVLLSKDVIRWGQTEYRRAGKYAELDAPAPTHRPHTDCIAIQGVSSDPLPDLASLEALLAGMNLPGFFGVVKGEIF